MPALGGPTAALTHAAPLSRRCAAVNPAAPDTHQMATKPYAALPVEDPEAPDEAKPHGTPLVTAKKIAAVALYCLAGPALIFLNKHILVEVDFPYPDAERNSGRDEARPG